MALLPAAVWTTLFVAFSSTRLHVREAALAAITVVTLSMLAMIELLSAFHLISMPWVTAVWALLLLAAVALAAPRLRSGLDRLRQDMASAIGTRSRSDGLALATFLFFVLGTLLSALLYPIVNHDSLTSHAVRVFFWFQNRSIAPYPTAFGPQLFEYPLGAYAVLMLKTLTGGSDRLANVVQWTSYVFSIVAVSLVSMRLGASRRGQQAAAIAAAAIPMAILQASTTQNDLNVAVWCLIAVYLVVTFIEKPTHLPPARWAAWTGVALGLALLAKPTAYMFLSGFFLWLTFAVVRRDGWRRATALAAAVLLAALLINGSWYARNAWLLNGDVIAISAPGVPRAVSRAHDPASLLTTAVKNGSMELGVPSVAVNQRIAAVVQSAVSLYSGKLEDLRTKESEEEKYALDERVTNHDVGPAPLTVVVILVSALTLLIGKRAGSRARTYLLCAALGGFLVSALIAWNHFINRLLVGSLLLLVPMVGLAFTLAERDRRRALRLALAATLALSVGWGTVIMLFNSTNRLVSPSLAPVSVGNRNLGWWNTSYDDLRFRVMTSHLEAAYKEMASAIKAAGIDRVGLNVHTGYPIYPLLAELSPRQVGYVGETLLPDRIPAPDFRPQAVVEIVPAEEYPAILQDGTARGESLIPPQVAKDCVLLLYRVP